MLKTLYKYNPVLIVRKAQSKKTHQFETAQGH